MKIPKISILVINEIEKENSDITVSLENLNYNVTVIPYLDDVEKVFNNINPELIIINMGNKLNAKIAEKKYIEQIAGKNIPRILIFPSGEKKYAKLPQNELIEYIYRPYSIDELAIRINQLIWIQKLQEDLKNKNEELEKVKLTDEITNLYNSTYLLERFDEEIFRARRYFYPLSCIMINIDNIDRLEEVYGQSSILILLKELGSFLKKCIRVVDIIGHYKKGCFLIILPQTVKKGAHILGERILDGIDNSSFVINDNIIKVKSSVVVIGEKVVDKEKFLAQLDKAMEEIKTQGGNKLKLEEN
ncbi:MAG: diguanylate cyclase [Candidatus Firestonebacteria bacterium]|nr:diguanylate cyclase [Candidatus Firestonebacteria bacterium]